MLSTWKTTLQRINEIIIINNNVPLPLNPFVFPLQKSEMANLTVASKFLAVNDLNSEAYQCPRQLLAWWEVEQRYQPACQQKHAGPEEFGAAGVVVSCGLSSLWPIVTACLSCVLFLDCQSMIQKLYFCFLNISAYLTVLSAGNMTDDLSIPVPRACIYSVLLDTWCTKILEEAIEHEKFWREPPHIRNASIQKCTFNALWLSNVAHCNLSGVTNCTSWMKLILCCLFVPAQENKTS